MFDHLVFVSLPQLEPYLPRVGSLALEKSDCEGSLGEFIRRTISFGMSQWSSQKRIGGELTSFNSILYC